MEGVVHTNERVPYILIGAKSVFDESSVCETGVNDGIGSREDFGEKKRVDVVVDMEWNLEIELKGLFGTVDCQDDPEDLIGIERRQWLVLTEDNVGEESYHAVEVGRMFGVEFVE